MKITIMRDQLVAALCTAGKADVREYLNSVYIEATNEETRITSTDGITLSIQRADAKGENEVVDVVRLIVPREVVEKVKKDKMAPTVEINDTGGSWGLVDRATRTGFTPMDRRYPDVRRVVPATTSGVMAQFDPRLVANFAKAAVALEATYKGMPQVAIAHNGHPTPGNKSDAATHSALVTLGALQNYIGVIMPLNNGDPGTSSPAWAQSALEPLAVAVEEENLA